MTMASIQPGFQNTGIFPVCCKMIKDSDLGPSTATDNLQNVAPGQGKKSVDKLLIKILFLFQNVRLVDIMQLQV